jgi:adenine-specific DNA methylase
MFFFFLKKRNSYKKEVLMKIEVEGAIIRLIPENKQEVEGLNKMWELVARCEEENKKLLPLGMYIPGSSSYAQFYVEGIQASADARESVRKIRYVCMICNRMEEYPEDRPTPVCCGQPMISMD